MLEELKQEVYEANLQLYSSGLVIFTWGNVSALSKNGLVVIKPSGIPYETMKPKDMVVVDLKGSVVEGELKPSSDLPTHIELYKACSSIKGICHTHSSYATSFAQAGISIEPLGTTHADYFYGGIPCTRELNDNEIYQNYESNTGKVIVETFKERNFNEIPACLVKNHGVFSWSLSAKQAVKNAVIVEEIAKMNFQTLALNANSTVLKHTVLDKHYQRKHGEKAYYGQRS